MSCRPVKVRFKQSYNDLVDKPKINGQVLEGDIEIEAGGGVSEIVIPTTHAELVTLRNAGELLAGCKYRITDYTTTVAEGIADIEVNGEPFDIIVTALNERTLSEEASAIQSPNTEYFNGANLAAWKVWYCLNNDADRFSWASETGKGVIYRLIDEWGNDIPYDFKSLIISPDGHIENAGYTLGYTGGDAIISDGSLPGLWRNCVVQAESAVPRSLRAFQITSPATNLLLVQKSTGGFVVGDAGNMVRVNADGELEVSGKVLAAKASVSALDTKVTNLTNTLKNEYRKLTDLDYYVTGDYSGYAWDLNITFGRNALDTVRLTLKESITEGLPSGVSRRDIWWGLSNDARYYCTLTHETFTAVGATDNWTFTIDIVPYGTGIIAGNTDKNATSVDFTGTISVSGVSTTLGISGSRSQYETIVQNALKEKDRIALNEEVASLLAAKYDNPTGAKVVLGRSASGATTAVAVGYYARATKDYSVALGYMATATQEGAIAIGYSAFASEEFPIVIGSGDIDLPVIKVAADGTLYVGDAEMAKKSEVLPRYAFATATVADGAVTLTPYAQNALTSDGTAFTVAMGGSNTHLRDCVFVVDCTSLTTAPTITWGTEFHPRTDAATDFACVAGAVNVYWITEYAEGQFAVAGWQVTAGGNAEEVAE